MVLTQILKLRVYIRISVSGVGLFKYWKSLNEEERVNTECNDLQQTFQKINERILEQLYSFFLGRNNLQLKGPITYQPLKLVIFILRMKTVILYKF